MYLLYVDSTTERAVLTEARGIATTLWPVDKRDQMCISNRHAVEDALNNHAAHRPVGECQILGFRLW